MLTRARSRSSSMETSGGEASQYLDSQDSAPLSLIEEVKPKKRSPKKKLSNKPGAKSLKTTQWVVVLPEAVLAEDIESESAPKPSLVHVTNKQTGCTQCYLLSADKHTLCELNKCSDKHRSWFINDTLQTDGSLHVCTPVDPLFLSLNLILSATTKLSKFMSLEILLDASDYDIGGINIEDLVSEEQWRNICDVKEVFGEKVYRYSEDRTLDWLSKKVTTLSSKLQSEGVYVGSGSQTSGFVRSKDTPTNAEEYLHYAAGMIGDYLPLSLKTLLLSKYPTTITDTGKRKIELDQDKSPSKKKKTSSGPIEDYSKLASIQPANKKNPVKLTAAQKSLAKVNKKGMKSLTSFFK